VHYCVDILKGVAQAFEIGHFAMNNFKFIYKPPMPSAEVVVNHWDKATFVKTQGDVRSYVSRSTYQENSQEKLPCAIIPTSFFFLERVGLPRFSEADMTGDSPRFGFDMSKQTQVVPVISSG
jgi:hypothetical protein